MFTKAYIILLPELGSNRFKVRVPLFEDNTGAPMIFDALLCNLPGLFHGYKVNDCVYVSFEGPTLNYPVIVGRLYTEVEQDSTMYTNTNELNVTTKATLPANTSFGGYTPKDFFIQMLKESTGQTYTAGEGIKIENNVISLDLENANTRSF